MFKPSRELTDWLAEYSRDNTYLASKGLLVVLTHAIMRRKFLVRDVDRFVEEPADRVKLKHIINTVAPELVLGRKALV